MMTRKKQTWGKRNIFKEANKREKEKPLFPDLDPNLYELYCYIQQYVIREKGFLEDYISNQRGEEETALDCIDNIRNIHGEALIE